MHLTNSYNSDGQWPPTLPAAPHIVHPFNYGYCFENLLQAELLVGGVDRGKLKTDRRRGASPKCCRSQQNLILKKAKRLAATRARSGRSATRLWRSTLIETSRNVESVKATEEHA